MKKIILTLGFLAMLGTLPPFTASADGYPWGSPIITGDPKLNREIRRPGPYTPKPKPAPTTSAAAEGEVVQISEGLIGTLKLRVEDVETGASMTFEVMAGESFVLPEGYILELFQNGKKIDSKML